MNGGFTPRGVSIGGGGSGGRRPRHHRRRNFDFFFRHIFFLICESVSEIVSAQAIALAGEHEVTAGFGESGKALAPISYWCCCYFAVVVFDRNDQRLSHWLCCLHRDFLPSFLPSTPPLSFLRPLPYGTIIRLLYSSRCPIVRHPCCHDAIP